MNSAYLVAAEHFTIHEGIAPSNPTRVVAWCVVRRLRVAWWEDVTAFGAIDSDTASTVLLVVTPTSRFVAVHGSRCVVETVLRHQVLQLTGQVAFHRQALASCLHALVAVGIWGASKLSLASFVGFAELTCLACPTRKAHGTIAIEGAVPCVRRDVSDFPRTLTIYGIHTLQVLATDTISPRRAFALGSDSNILLLLLLLLKIIIIIGISSSSSF